MTMHQKNARFELKREPDQDGNFEGYASVFDVVDQGMDSVAKGAFVKSLDVRKPKMLWQHDQNQVIGVWEEVKEDARGLYVKGRILKEIKQGAEALTLLKAGVIDSMSIGYRAVEATKEGNGSVRKLLQVDLFEVSLVTFPMLEDAMITDIKSITTERDFEKFLRDAGYSKTQAVALTLHGFKAIDTQRDAGDEALIEGLNDLQSTLIKLKDTFK
jgi:HK97 family phage prohead protease